MRYGIRNLIFAAVLFAPATLFAQQPCLSGIRIEGVVTDPTGALVPGAQVLAGNQSATTDVLDLAFGVDGQVLASSGVGSSERCLNVLRSRRENELSEVKVERAGATEAAGWLSLGDGPNHGGALGNRDGVVGIIDRFRDGGLDLLRGFGRGGA